MQVLKKFIKPAFPFLLALVTLFVLLVFKNNPTVTERLYSHGIYPIVASILSFVSNRFPFSIDNVFYISLVFAFVVGVVCVIFKKLSIGKFLLHFFQLLAIVFCMFYWFWGFNYYRSNAHQRIHIAKTFPDHEIFIKIFKEVIHNTNASYAASDLFNQTTCDSAIEKSFCKLADFLNISYPTGSRRVKHVVFSDFFAKATILGYYGPFFSEVHMNKHLLSLDIPITMAHEKAHQFGVTGEAEASFYGWLVCIRSDDKYVKYSGWLFALDYFIYEARQLENRSELIELVQPQVIEDLKFRHKYWGKWRSAKIDRFASKVNDAYLKSNNVEKGVKDYNGVVQLIVDFHEIKNSF